MFICQIVSLKGKDLTFSIMAWVGTLEYLCVNVGGFWLLVLQVQVYEDGLRHREEARGPLWNGHV